MAAKTVYIFDQTTHEFVEPYDAQESPLEPGVFIEPASSTDVAPPAAAADQAPVWDPASSAWSLQPDYRGQTVYDTATLVGSEVTAIGPIPAGKTLLVPAPNDTWDGVNNVWALTLDTAQKLQVAALYEACGAAITAGFLSSALGSAYTYPSQPIDQSNLVGAVTDSYNPKNPTTWTRKFWCADANGSWAMVPHTAAQIQQVLADGVAQREAYSAKLDSLVAQVNAATDVSTVQGVGW